MSVSLLRKDIIFWGVGASFFGTRQTTGCYIFLICTVLILILAVHHPSAGDGAQPGRLGDGGPSQQRGGALHQPAGGR
jgi:hypothetical protein